MTNPNFSDQQNQILIDTISRFHMWNKFMSIPRIALFWSKVKIGNDSECWPWIGNVFDDTGYGRFSVKHGSKTKTFGAHRVAFEISKGPIPENLHVLHSCIASRTCCNPFHLRVGTHIENMQDAIDQNRFSIGEDHHAAKLTPASVIEIRKLLSSGISQNNIAKKFGVTRVSIRKIARGQTWRHV